MTNFIGPWLLLSCMVISLPGQADSQEKKQNPKKQRELLLDQLNQAGIKKPIVQETQNLILGGSITEKEMKQLSISLQKQYTLAHKALKFTDQDQASSGKMLVLVFAEKREYASYSRLIRGERPEVNETNSLDASGDDLIVAILADAFPLDVEVQATVAVALLERKAGVNGLPLWMRNGFRKAISWKFDPKSAEVTRKTIRGLLNAKGKPPISVGDSWSLDSEYRGIAAASLMEYLVFHAEPGKLTLFLSGFRPTEENPEPNFTNALMAAGWKTEELDELWRAWILKTK